MQGEFHIVQEIYISGGNSKSYAKIELDTSLFVPIFSGVVVKGTSIDDLLVTGTEYKYSTLNNIKIQYNTSEDQSRWVGFRVGELESCIISGCLIDDEYITTNGLSYDYSYKPLLEHI